VQVDGVVVEKLVDMRMKSNVAFIVASERLLIGWCVGIGETIRPKHIAHSQFSRSAANVDREEQQPQQISSLFH